MSKVSGHGGRYHHLLTMLQWAGLLASFTLAIYAATRSRQSPQIILLALLYLITINLSLPFTQGNAGLVTVVSMSSILLIGLRNGIILLIASLLLAELLRPLWAPLWHDLDAESHRQRLNLRIGLGKGLVYLFALVVAAEVFLSSGGKLPFPGTDAGLLTGFVELSASYAVAYLLATFALWMLARKPYREFPLVPLGVEGFLSHPFALLGALLFTQNGTPAFVIFCLSIAGSSLIIWLSWRRRAILELQFLEFSLLNVLGKSLRETLDMQSIVAKIKDHVLDLVPVERISLAFLRDDGTWEMAFDSRDEPTPTQPANAGRRQVLRPDDFMLWVAKRGEILDLNPGNMHFAHRHGLASPEPKPRAWLGIPLKSAGSVIGVLALQRFASTQPFGRWDRELLLSIAGQASAAIQNARLYQETVRLYALTDEALAQRVNELHALLDAMDDGVLMLDSGGRIVLVNNMAAGLLGGTSAELRGNRLPVDRMGPSIGYEERELAELMALLSKGETPPRRPAMFESFSPESAKGARRYVSRADAPVAASDGTLLGWLMLFKDVTEERELAALRVDLTRMIVHDLRNPLTTLISNIELLENQPGAASGRFDADGQELLSRARHGGYDMLDLVDSMMDISRMEAGRAVVEADAMHLPPLVNRVLERLEPLSSQKKITMQFECEPKLPPVWADEEMIRRVLMNLLDNALKFTPSGGKVIGHLTAESRPSDWPGGGVRCVITDSGPGIPEDVGDRIFDRFMRTNLGGGQVRGTGLGLAFCKLAIEAHGGKIWVEAAPGEGSRFSFTLPGVPYS
jgi:PAS domain S-box-containing protein